jgi:transcription elongation factor Elf1
MKVKVACPHCDSEGSVVDVNDCPTLSKLHQTTCIICGNRIDFKLHVVTGKNLRQVISSLNALKAVNELIRGGA